MEKLHSNESKDPAQMTTPELVEACIAGDGRAWESLLEKYQRLIYSIPIQAGLSRSDAAEVFQIVSIKLLRKLATLRDQNRLAKWIITTTTRESWRLAVGGAITYYAQNANAFITPLERYPLTAHRRGC